MPYRNEIVSMTKWCKLYNLLLNVKKIKKLYLTLERDPMSLTKYVLITKV